MFYRSVLRNLAIGCSAAAFLTVVAPAVQAQDLSRDVQALKRDLADLQRYIYNGQSGTPPQSLGQVGGSGEVSGDVAAHLQVKIQEMEHNIRSLNGRVEEADFKLRQLTQRLDTALADMEYRLARLEGGNPVPPGQVSSTGGQPTTQTEGMASGASGQQIIPVPGQQQGSPSIGTTVISSAGTETPQAGAQNAPQGGTLGSLILDAQGNVVGGEASVSATQGSGPAPQAGGPDTPPPAPNTISSSGPVEGADLAQAGQTSTASLPTEPQALYDYSLGLMRQGDYPGAENALRVFLDQHSNSDLTGAALYWLGETYYVRNNYRDAAFSFIDVYSKYPKNSKAPDSLLKLGMSLHALGNKAEACSAFQTLKADYPDARRAVLKLAEERAAEYGC